MNFTALNEKGEVGYALVASSRKTVTRRIFKRKCPKCKKPMSIEWGSRRLEGEQHLDLVAMCDDCEIKRKIIAVGDLLAVFPGRWKGPAVCVCGKRKDEHFTSRYGEKITATYLCSPLKTEAFYRPLKVRVKSIMRHEDWLTSIGGQEHIELILQGKESVKFMEAMQKEAVAEGFYSVDSWVDFYPKHGEKIEDTWRIEFGKVT